VPGCMSGLVPLSSRADLVDLDGPVLEHALDPAEASEHLTDLLDAAGIPYIRPCTRVRAQQLDESQDLASDLHRKFTHHVGGSSPRPRV
jgi:hypothetical protein